MVRYLTGRLLLGVVVLWLLSGVVFVLFFVAPSDPAALIAGEQASGEQVAAVRRALGLDLSVMTQYGRFLRGLLVGDLGHSYYSQESVTALLADRAPVTGSVVAGGLALAALIGVAGGAACAAHPRSLVDRALTAWAMAVSSTPAFLLGLFLLYLLFVRLRSVGVAALPGSGYAPLADGPGEWLRHLVLPWTAVGLVASAHYIRIVRAFLLDVLATDYIRTARAKGMGERTVVLRHGLRAALTPLTSQFGVDLATLLGGVAVTETVFGLPGLGQLMVQSVTSHDLPVIMGVVLLSSAFIVAANIAVDALYATLDPRVRRGE